MAIYRRVCDKPFTKATNDLLRDPSVSSVAKVVLWCIASHRQDYKLTMAQLVAQIHEGRDAVRRALKELESKGFLARVQRRGERGAITHTDFYIVDDPSAGLATDFQAVVTSSGNTESSQVVTGDWISGDGGTPPKKNSEEDQEEHDVDAAPTLTRRADEFTPKRSRAEEEAEAWRLIEDTLDDDGHPDILIPYLVRHLGVAHVDVYVQSIIDSGGITGLAAQVELARSWDANLDESRDVLAKFLVDNRCMTAGQAGAVADTYRDALSWKCPPKDLEVAINNAIGKGVLAHMAEIKQTAEAHQRKMMAKNWRERQTAVAA